VGGGSQQELGRGQDALRVRGDWDRSNVFGFGFLLHEEGHLYSHTQVILGIPKRFELGSADVTLACNEQHEGSSGCCVV
jgi:hypothetical protein